MARICAVVAAMWGGLLLCIALLATPAVFAALTSAEAGRVVVRIFAQEATTSLVLGMALVVLLRKGTRRETENSRAGTFVRTEVLLALVAIFCTVLGYFALQPMMTAARAGQGPWSFGQLHVASLVMFGLKTAAVLALAWRLSKS